MVPLTVGDGQGRDGTRASPWSPCPPPFSREPRVVLDCLQGAKAPPARQLMMDAEQGVQMLQIVKPKRAIPIHYNDYDVFESPLSDFQRAVEAAGLAHQVHYLSQGDTYPFTVPAS
jgi:hypothetical protein